LRDWRDISYLERGNDKQASAYEWIDMLGILDDLAAFDPALVSTVCVGLDVAGSDLDIICRFEDPQRFRDTVVGLYGTQPRFRFSFLDEERSQAVASFKFGEFRFEIFGSRTPIEQQPAYRHLQVMSRLVELGGDPFQRAVRRLKTAGVSTEPAIAQLLELPGDPYQAVAALEDASDAELRRRLERAGLQGRDGGSGSWTRNSTTGSRD
jgi:hypothetical protein